MRVYDIPRLAQLVYSGTLTNENKQKIYSELISFVGDWKQLPSLIHILAQKDQSSLMVASVLLQSLEKGIYTPQLDEFQEQLSRTQDRLEQQTLQNAMQQIKYDIYWRLTKVLLSMLKAGGMPSYLVGTIEQLASRCLKSIFLQASDTPFLIMFITLAFYGIPLKTNFSDYSSEIHTYVFEPYHIASNIDPGLRILSQLVDYIGQYCNYKSYFVYRRTTSIFKNSFLSLILMTAVKCTKSVVLGFNLNPYRARTLSLCLKLLENIVLFPFNSSLSYFECYAEAQDQYQAEVYYPSYFRHLTNDYSFLKGLCELHRYLVESMKQTSNTDGSFLGSIITIFGRLFVAHSYYFHDEMERKRYRQLCIEICCYIMKNHRPFDDYYTNSILSVVRKLLVTYSTDEISQQFRPLTESVLQFCKVVVTECPIRFDGPSAPSKCFELLRELYNNNPLKSTMCTIEVEDDLYRPLPTESIFDKMFQYPFLEIYSLFMAQLGQANRTGKYYREAVFRNYEKYIKCFQEMFKPICFIFDKNLYENVNRLTSIPLGNLSSYMLSLVIYFVTIMAFEDRSHRSTIPIKLVVPYYLFIKYRRAQTLSELNFLHYMIGKLLYNVRDGVSDSALWNNICQEYGNNIFVFYDVISNCIDICIDTFCRTNISHIDCSLAILKMIFKGLRQHNVYTYDANMLRYFRQFESFLKGIKQTVFDQPDYLKKRIDLFEMISLLWLEYSDIANCYTFYYGITTSLKSAHDVTNLLKYLYDLTGLVGNLNNSVVYKVVIEIVMPDLYKIYSVYLYYTFLSNEQFRKALLKLADALLRDNAQRMTREVTTNLPIICDMLWRLLEKCIKYPFGRRFLTIWKRLVEINPIKPLPPLPYLKYLSNEKHKDLYQQLVQSYFDNILRVADLNQLYPLNNGSLYNLYNWWEAAIYRYIVVNLENFGSIIQSKPWRTNREHQTVGKIVFMAGQHDHRYRVLPELFERFPSENEFIDAFIKATI